MLTTGNLQFICCIITLILLWLAAFGFISPLFAILLGVTLIFLIASYDIWRD